MARIFIDGFESGDHDMWDAEDNATVVSSTGLDMDGDYCLDLNSSVEYLQKNITANDEMYFAFLWRPTSLASNLNLLAVFSNTVNLITLLYSTSSSILKIYMSDTGSLLAIGTYSFSINTTYLIEVRIKIADSAGRVEVKVNNTQDIDFTGDTKPGADTQFTKVRLGCSTLATLAYFDNFIMDDAAWIGDTKIQAILPTGAGATTGWIPSAGANYACVDERPPSDVDHVSINANDAVDTYAAGNMAGTIGSVKCVQIQSRTRTDGTPTPTNLKLVARSGATDYLSGNKAIPAAEKGLHSLWENNPADSAAWEEADVNALEIGIKSAA